MLAGAVYLLRDTKYVPLCLDVSPVASSYQLTIDNNGFVDCKTVFIASKIGLKDLSVHHQVLLANSNNESQLRRLVYLGSGHQPKEGSRITTLSYSTFLNSGHVNDSTLAQAEGKVRPSDALNLQFTSGKTCPLRTHDNAMATENNEKEKKRRLLTYTDNIGTTGNPKAAVLTHK